MEELDKRLIGMSNFSHKYECEYNNKELFSLQWTCIIKINQSIPSSILAHKTTQKYAGN